MGDRDEWGEREREREREREPGKSVLTTRPDDDDDDDDDDVVHITILSIKPIKLNGRQYLKIIKRMNNPSSADTDNENYY